MHQDQNLREAAPLYRVGWRRKDGAFGWDAPEEDYATAVERATWWNANKALYETENWIEAAA